MVPFSHYLSSSRFKDVTTWSEQKSGLDDGVELVCFCRLELSGSVGVHSYEIVTSFKRFFVAFEKVSGKWNFQVHFFST